MVLISVVGAFASPPALAAPGGRPVAAHVPPSLAATDAPPPALVDVSPAPPPVVEKSAPVAPRPDEGVRFEMQAKVGSGIMAVAGLTPTLYLGIHTGHLSVLLGGTVTRGSLGNSFTQPTYDMAGKAIGQTTTSSELSFTLVSFVPTVTYDLLVSKDEKAALYVLAGIVLGGLNLNNAASGPPNPCASQTTFIAGYQAAIGARVALHRNFRLGVEAGPTGQFAAIGGNTSCSSGGTMSTTTSSGWVGATAFYGALMGSFIWR